ncbi:MAG: hypothetical protein KME31_24720 [Tolypothrix carrinoi HA7290-LM1]|nr:hypothetical protein [Tolypothrix carrinoi HA7290-LM1]
MNLGKISTGRNSGATYFAYKSDRLKQFKKVTSDSGMFLQKLILKSRVARLLAIRQVTQALRWEEDSTPKGGKKSLTFKERFGLEELLKAFSNNWKHQKLRSIPWTEPGHSLDSQHL